MPLSPKAQAFLEMGATRPTQQELGPVGAREAQSAAPRIEGPAVAGVRDEHVPGRGGPVMVRIYDNGGPGPKAGLIWIHGGGWVIGSVETNDPTCRSLAVESGAVVISVEYRLSPETRFPGALEDSEDVTRWVFENAAQLGVDPARVAIGGASAGANLATTVSMKLRDENGPVPAHQILVVPVTDRRSSTGSFQEFADGHALTSNLMDWYWGHYLRDDADGDNPYVSPLRAGSLKGLPPATVITAEFDPLRDEGKAYADRLEAEGVAVSYRCYDGMIHMFFNTGAPMEETAPAIAFASDAVRSLA